jgi:RNA polymerase sigma-70 factor (ECF subfamily)
VAIARNLANDYHRRLLPEEPLPEGAPHDDVGHGDTSAERRTAEQSGTAAAILDAIRSLPDAYRETLILRLVEGFTGPEIAARTGLTHGSVRVNLHRGMEQLRAKLRPSPSSGQPEQEML